MTVFKYWTRAPPPTLYAEYAQIVNVKDGSAPLGAPDRLRAILDHCLVASESDEMRALLLSTLTELQKTGHFRERRMFEGPTDIARTVLGYFCRCDVEFHTVALESTVHLPDR
jgi:hypothetical protein